ncbi:Formyltransferase/hydrolase complex Fhc subunit C [Rubripirellula lacrimiformis]|uniref:Formyltransferase/hydrolase complex Fhc subunit C n=1 Tax=Rubripirellula lacrimiformis TaxID=1930273 RepID=A0A517NHB0_9BACT|nr:hypothetical protein [Rubripirellula lacrimiformis]QDT06524.1 Formyltransferase/hydrolase complex Fhc subunit C [Rubripirellula lacrimiformis]
MTRWTLTRHVTSGGGLDRDDGPMMDASCIDPARFAGQSDDWILSQPIGAGRSGEARLDEVRLGDWFELQTAASDEPGLDTVVIRGDVGRFSHIGGNLASGQIMVDGNVGDFLGSAVGGNRTGLSGGRIVVSGNAGSHVGHRMRRGEIWIGGDAGDFLAAHMVAGTIAVAGSAGPDLAIGMRRGTVLLSEMPELPSGRFTAPIRSRYLFGSLISVPEMSFFQQGCASIDRLIHRLCGEWAISRRGDRAVGGQGEVVSGIDR